MDRKSLRYIIDSVKFYIDLEKISDMQEHFFKGLSKKNETAAREAPRDLNSLKKEVLSCTRCDLYLTRRNMVFGSGNPKAALMFIGEAPGEEEDRQRSE